MKLRTLLLFAVAASLALGGQLTLDLAHPGGQVSPRLYGLMTEEINHSYDGGLYAELVRNRAFLDDAQTPVNWSVVTDGSAEAEIALDKSQPLNDAIPVSLRFDTRKLEKGQRSGFANSGYWGIPVQPKTKYRASFYAKTSADDAGRVSLSIESADGRTIFASGTSKRLTKEWQRFEVVLKTGEVAATTNTRFVVRVDRPGTTWFSLVSLFPPTWNDRPNGLRKDLMQMLVDLQPKFLRFPGGNYLEGNTIAERFPWKKTLGPISERPGHPCNWGYRSTDGLGLLEFLEWCEDMHAEPVLAVYAGYSLGGEYVKPGPDLEPFIQEALEEIEYVVGDKSTVWGARRARDGHPAPFKLTYVEIGNEDGFDKANTYDARFAQFFDAIKKKYPSLELISTLGDHDREKRVHSRQPDLCDEHYYNTSDAFLKMSRGMYDRYERKGPRVFVGEWAAYETSFPPWDSRSLAEPPTPTLKAAIADAAFMTEMERNSDLVLMHCYAPLLVNVNPGARQWRPNLIGYDALRSFGSPSYYAFKMFSTHVGDELVKLTAQDTGVFASATRRGTSGDIFLKLVNPAEAPETLSIHCSDTANLAPTARAVVLSASSTSATNSIDAPATVVPLTRTVASVKSGFVYTVPANAVVVLTLRAR